MNINDLTIDSLEKENYFATQDLVDVVNAAIFLNKPLLRSPRKPREGKVPGQGRLPVNRAKQI